MEAMVLLICTRDGLNVLVHGLVSRDVTSLKTAAKETYGLVSHT